MGKTCRHCWKRHCRCPRPRDPFRSQLAMATDDPELHRQFIDGLARQESLRIAAGSASAYAPDVQAEIDVLVCIGALLVPPPGARPPADLVRRQQLAAFRVLPDVIRGLEAVHAAWALLERRTAPALLAVAQRALSLTRSWSSLFGAFRDKQKALNDLLRSPGFWETEGGEDVVTRRPLDAAARRIVSPYFENVREQRGGGPLAPWQPLLQPHRLALNGDNTWLDRFLYARTALRLACGALLDVPLVERALAHTSTPEDGALPLALEVRLALAAVKAEFYTVWALLSAPPALPLPDPSAAGRAPAGKFTAVRNSFVVWTSGNEHERLTDPHSLRPRLRCAHELRALGAALAELPGDWPPVAAALAATLAALRARQLAALAQVAAGDALRSAPGWRDPRSAKSNHDAFHDSVRRLRIDTHEAHAKKRFVGVPSQMPEAFDMPEAFIAEVGDVRKRLNPYRDVYIAAALAVADDAVLARLVGMTPGGQQAWRFDSRSVLRRLNPDASAARFAEIFALAPDELRRLASPDDAAPAKRDKGARGKRNKDSDSDDSDDAAEAGAPLRRARSLTESMAVMRDPDVQAAILASLLPASAVEHIPALTPAELLQPAFGEAAVAAAFRARGVAVPPRLPLAQQKELLLLLLLDLPPAVVVAAFADKGVPIVWR